MRIFISQPMKDKSREEILSAREIALKDIFNRYGTKDIEIIESVLSAPVYDPTYNASLWTLGSSLKILARADAAYFVEGWQSARGCRIEHQCCVDYGILILNE